MNTHPAIQIVPFQPEHQQEAQRLILAGLEQHWGTLDPEKNPDLEDIGRAYARAVFLVALRDNRVVGTGALLPGAGESAEIVRMSVAAELRRQGIGRQILISLVEHARRLGFRHLVLETTESWFGVIEFYQQFGFKVTHHREGDVYFSLDLAET